MKVLEKQSITPRMRQRPPKPARPNRSTPEPTPPDIELALVSFRSGEAVHRHPALQSWIERGWQVRSAVPRIVEHGVAKLLVVLERPIFNPERSHLAIPSSRHAPAA